MGGPGRVLEDLGRLLGTVSRTGPKGVGIEDSVLYGGLTLVAGQFWEHPFLKLVHRKLLWFLHKQFKTLTTPSVPTTPDPSPTGLPTRVAEGRIYGAPRG